MLHPTIHELAVGASPRRHRHLHPPRPGRRVRQARTLVAVGSHLVRVGVRLRTVGAAQVASPRSGAPPGPRVVT